MPVLSYKRDLYKVDSIRRGGTVIEGRPVGEMYVAGLAIRQRRKGYGFFRIFAVKRN